MLPGGPEFGVPYELEGPDGQRAVFNDDSDPDYVGVLAEVSGLDSPEVRENAADRVEADGGVHGNFWYGRRPFVLTGRLLAGGSAALRNERATKLLRATNAMRADGILRWTPNGSVEQFVRYRRQQPVRITGGFNKECQVALVSSDAPIYSSELLSDSVDASSETPGGRTYNKVYNYSYATGSVVGATLTATNQGSADTPATLTLTGSITDPVITNVTTGEAIALDVSLAAGEQLQIDTGHRSIIDPSDNQNRYSTLNFADTTWWALAPGSNTIRLDQYSNGAGASLLVEWRHAWI
jgi:hypothetical protein